MKNIAILGSTGSIGINALRIAGHFPEKFRIIGLSTKSNVELLKKQIKEFNPRFIVVREEWAAKKLKPFLSPGRKLFVGEEGLKELVAQKELDVILLGISGSCALRPLLEAIRASKQIALANKEALVMAGQIIMQEAKGHGAKILPVDSEQSAIWQCLEGRDAGNLKNIYLTASGGPFRKTSLRRLKNISVEEVLRHPRWQMGKKISVDSASLMNKGLEVLEAMFLFDIPACRIKILIHPEAIIHSMVEFRDSVVLAQLSATDMRIPIQYALSYPDRFANSLPSVDFYKLKSLHFEEPDFKKFPTLRIAYHVAANLGTMPAVMNAANEICVEEFLKGRIKFLDISRFTEKVLDRHSNRRLPTLEDILEADSWARQEAFSLMQRKSVSR